MRAFFVAALLGVVALAAGCQQQEMIQNAERQSQYQAPRNLSSNLIQWNGNSGDGYGENPLRADPLNGW
jgi:hypothetical protein